jgi:serine protease
VPVSGAIRFSPTFRAAVVESEPNDSLGEAQLVGDLRVGERVTIVGHADAAGDPMDGFHLRATSRLRVTATLTHGGASDLDLLVYDATGMQFVETFQGAAGPETGTFHAKGAFDVVVRATSGASTWELTLVADPPASPVAEREPNDGPGSAQYLGEVVPGDALSVVGTATVGADGTDAFLVACPAAARLSLSLSFPAFQDLDVRVLDATGDLLAPAPLAAFEATTPSPESGVVDVPAGRLLHVEVRAKTGGGLWTLALAAATPPVPATAALVRETAAPLARLSAEGDRLRGPPPRAPYGRAPVPAVAGEAVVCLREGQEERGEAEIAARGGRILDRSGPRRRVAFDLPATEGDEDRARRTLSRARGLEGASATACAQTNRVHRPLVEPNDAYYGLQWHYEQIRLPEAWAISTGSTQTVVAVLDTGIAPHPDVPAGAGGYDFVSDPWMARDGNGRDPDPTDPGDLAYGSWSTFHGTHVAGTVGARTNNATGVAGVCWSVHLLHVRVLGRGGGTSFDIGEGIRYAAGLSNASGQVPPAAARVINMSLGGPGPDTIMEQACVAARAAGVLVVAAAGNDTSTGTFSPASFASVISVGSVGYAKTRAPYSNYGPNLDLMAPGGNAGVDQNADGYEDGVLSAHRDDFWSPPVDGYEFMQGTSMASPHVAGVAGLLFAVDPTLTADEARTILQETAQDLGLPGRDNDFGHGLVDAYAALVRAGAVPPPPTPTLGISPAVLSFGSAETTLDAAISNVGGGTLHVQAPVVEDAASAPWLTAQLVGPGDATKDAAALRVTVDRGGLGSGAYLARVTVPSDGGSVVVQVVMTVVLAPPPVPDIDIHVQAVDVASGGVALETVVNPRTGLSFLFGALSVGRYRFFASTDVDRDGVLCEEGEYCGAFPLLSDPAIVDLVAGNDYSGLTFPVNLVSGVGP